MVKLTHSWVTWTGLEHEMLSTSQTSLMISWMTLYQSVVFSVVIQLLWIIWLNFISKMGTHHKKHSCFWFLRHSKIIHHLKEDRRFKTSTSTTQVCKSHGMDQLTSPSAMETFSALVLIEMDFVLQDTRSPTMAWSISDQRSAQIKLKSLEFKKREDLDQARCSPWTSNPVRWWLTGSLKRRSLRRSHMVIGFKTTE